MASIMLPELSTIQMMSTGNRFTSAVLLVPAQVAPVPPLPALPDEPDAPAIPALPAVPPLAAVPALPASPALPPEAAVPPAPAVPPEPADPALPFEPVSGAGFPAAQAVSATTERAENKRTTETVEGMNDDLEREKGKQSFGEGARAVARHCATEATISPREDVACVERPSPWF
jgi:hypothetical protein